MIDSFFKKIYEHPAITPENYAQLIAAHTKVEFSKNDMILKEGEISNAYYLIEKGLFRSFVIDYSGNEITINFFGDSEILIEVSSLFQRVPSNENLQALTAGVAWKIDFDIFQELFQKIEGFAEWGRGWMSNQLFVSKQRSIRMLTHSAKERYLNLIKEQPKIVQEAPLKHIASYLGITDTSLSRIRKEIAQEM